MRFIVLAVLVGIAFWYSTRAGMRVRSARVGLALLTGLVIRIAVSLVTTHYDLVGTTGDPTTYEVNSTYLAAGWRVASSVQPPATITKNLAMVIWNALLNTIPGPPALHTSTALVAVVAASMGIGLIVCATHRALFELDRIVRERVVFRTAILCSIIPSVLYATTQNLKEGYQVLGMGLVIDGMSHFLGPKRRVAPARIVLGALIVGLTRPALLIFVPVLVLAPFAVRSTRNRVRAIGAVLGLATGITVILPLAGGAVLRTQFLNTASLGGGSKLSMPAGRVGSTAVTVVRSVWATEPWFVVRSPLGLLSWIESITLGTSLAWALVRLARSAFRGRLRPFVLGLSVLCLLPAWVIAASTGNGGALVRYRTPFLITALPLIALATASRRGTIESSRRRGLTSRSETTRTI